MGQSQGAAPSPAILLFAPLDRACWSCRGASRVRRTEGPARVRCAAPRARARVSCRLSSAACAPAQDLSGAGATGAGRARACARCHPRKSPHRNHRVPSW
eukprot:15467976-Alexandrium_andersonii.AAC.1